MARNCSKFNVLLVVVALCALTSACSSDSGGGGATDNQPDAHAPDSSETQDVRPEDVQADVEDTGTPGGGGADTRSDIHEDDARAPDASDADTEDVLPPNTGHAGCTFPPEEDADCPAYAYGDYGPASFITQFIIRPSGTCCADFNGDGRPDSALGTLTQTLQSVIGMPFNDVIDIQIRAGRMAFLFQYAYFSAPEHDPALDMNLLFGVDADDDFEPNLAGDGEFLIDPRSLGPDGQPLSSFASASVRDGRLVASNGQAKLLLPLNVDASLMTQIDVQKLRVEADVDPDADLMAGGRVTLLNGEMSGAVPLSEFFAALNLMTADCGCIKSKPIFVPGENGRWTCTNPFLSQDCAQDPDPMCEALGNQGVCQFVADAVSDQADVDLGNTGSYNALSLGATFQAVGTSIVGVAP